jgi:hypothetical protein
MRQAFLLTLLAAIISSNLHAQAAEPEMHGPDLQKAFRDMNDMKPKFGIKAGYNIAKITGSTPNYSPDTKNGFMVAAFYSPSTRSGFGYRSELVFSRQGFGFDEAGKMNSITSDYIYLPQFTTFGITKFVQLQVGGQIGYLLKSSKETTAEAKSQDITSFANRIDYGAAAGIEVYPFKGLILGGRYNFSLGDAYRQPATGNPIPIPNPLPFNPSDVKGKNAVINFFIGYHF